MTTTEPRPEVEAGAHVDDEPTIGKLVADTTAGFSTLLHNEIALAKTELKVSVKNGGLGAALFAVAGFLLVLGIIMLSFSCAYWLQTWFTSTIAFLITFGAYALIAVLLAVVGITRLKKIKAPEQTISTMKDTKEVLKRK